MVRSGIWVSEMIPRARGSPAGEVAQIRTGACENARKRLKSREVRTLTPPGTPRSTQSLAAIVWGSLFTASCVLFVPESTVGEHCAFDGAQTACGACLRSVCASAIDDACRDRTQLQSVVPVMEECAAKSDDACDRVPASDVASCMKEKCGAFCYFKSGQSQTHCTESFLAPGLACTCDTTGSPNDLKCASDAYPRARCCAPSGWPGPGLECTCAAIACAPTQDGCNCVLTDNLDSTIADTCSGAHCCATSDHCQCRARVCTGGEREVATCTKTELGCPEGRREVASCAIRQ
jgi:hypothetical protein